jgi:MerR family transcriptional regulator, redox-sensitive transcriptional activator SoxR
VVIEATVQLQLMFKSSVRADDRRAFCTQRRLFIRAPLLRAPGLIASRRTDGNQRRYDRATLRRVALVQAGKAAGIPLERVRAALETLPNRRTPTKRDWEGLSRSWARELDERIETLQAIRGRLTTCIGCGCLSLRTCSLLNPADEAAARGAGAHYFRRRDD